MTQRPLAGAKALERHHWYLLGVLGAATFFEGYDSSIIGVALPQIRHTFHLTQAAASLWVSVVFLGALPALVLTRRADRVGRRRLLLISLTGFTVVTGLTSLAPNMAAFVVCQFFAFMFLTAEGAIAWTMAAEELPAAARGFGFGWLAMYTALGTGWAAILFGGILDPLGISWRWLYVNALPLLLALAWFRRRLPESRRFTAARDAGRLVERWHTILRPPHRRWLTLVAVTAFLSQLTQFATVFTIDFLETGRHLSATAASFVLVGAGLPCMPLLAWSGSLSDRYGRKLIGCAFATVGLAGAACFFFIDLGVVFLIATLTVTLAGSLVFWPILNGYASELFPTGLRGQATSWANVFRVTGQFTSLGLGALLLHTLGGLPATVAVLGVGPLATIVVVAARFPQTHGRELEDIGEVPLPAAIPLA